MTLLIPPSVVRGMKIFNKELFNTIVSVPSLKVEEAKLSKVTKCLKKYFLKLENIKPIQTLESPSDKIAESYKNVYLNPSIVQSWDDIKVEDQEILLHNGIDEKLLEKTDLKLNYDNWKADEILKAILPSDKECLASYSNIGHIVHVNLKDHLLEYKDVIGKVLIDKVKGCETVVNKVNTIDNTYRNFQMEVLAGKANFQTTVRENNCSFEFDFSKVYWNPRLSTEHLRIVDMLKKDNVLFDVFAGVGPFSIPAAKKKCFVYSNDLNPESYKWLLHNAKLNKISNKFSAQNLDGKDFICNYVPKYLYEVFTEEKFASCSDVYFVMNLPAMAVEFLKYYKGILKDYDDNKLANFKKPIVHVYCFVSGENSIEEAKRLVEENMEMKLEDDLLNVSYVRNVAPNKEMMRVTFYLTKDILFDSTPPASNKRKRDEIDN